MEKLKCMFCDNGECRAGNYAHIATADIWQELINTTRERDQNKENLEWADAPRTTDKYELIYPDFAEDVVRCDTEEEIDELMAKIQRMEPDNGK